MSDFRSIWDKVGGGDVVRQVFREHMATSTALATLAVGTSRKGLEIVRNVMQLKLCQRIRSKMAGDLPELKEQVEREYTASTVRHNDTVWTLWLQGEDAAPEIVRACIASMREHLPNKRVAVLDEGTMLEGVTLPEHVMRKYEAGTITRTHLSDLLRLELLTTVGGTWADATVWLSGTPEAFVTDSDLFMYQSMKPGLDGKSICMSSWLMTAQAPSRILLLARDLLYRYWERSDRMDDYFLVHYMLQMAIDEYPDEWARVVPSSNSTPHVLLLRLGEAFDEAVFDGVCAQTAVHKLTYKGVEEMPREGTYLGCVLGSQGGAR
ncbi:MAG: capsular polysaccharide synthesis protein [Olsenella sp.]|nr:capsular polysaccharide synthesis protein [Olsenella sp.]